MNIILILNKQGIFSKFALEKVQILLIHKRNDFTLKC